jgi:superfamily II DNA or RNA helicase
MNEPSFLDINSWDDFRERLASLNKKEKGNSFELLTKLYFKINPIYSFYEEVWLFDEVPSKELEYLGLPPQDLGIDLIAKHGNEYHAIQCKYHSDKTSSVTFKEVSTFISLLESNNKITQGYICSSADLTSRNFNKLKTKPINLIMSDSWQMLDEEFFNDVRKTLEGKKVKLNPFQPRPHQKKALKESKNYFIQEDHSRGKLIFPCGAGKSLTGFWITQELKSKSTIIAVPSLSLVKQTLEVYLREIVANNKRIKWLCICSDEGIGKNDDVAIFTENLGVPCQTDPSYIEQWLKDNIDEEKIIFTTYQSGRIISEISKRLNFKFDVGIFDEAHKTVGSSKKLFSHLLFEENISIEKRIFMTATERFYAGSKDDIISMDDEDIYGETFTQMSFKEAIEIGLLTDYKVITIDINKSEIAEFIRDNNLVQLNDKWKKETEARSLASMLALRKAMKRFSIKNAVSFHSSIEKAVRNKELQKHITETYNYAPIDTYTVSGKQSTSKRNDIVQEFASSDKALITNARCLTEGVDVPNIDCIVFADPRKSRVDIVQALGRALRKKEGKDWGYVILPVIYDEETQEIDNDSFNEILSIVRGLSSNDERIVDYFKDKNQKEASKEKETSEQFNFEVLSDYIDESTLSEQLQIRLWNKLARFNWLPFEEARLIVRDLGLSSFTQWREFSKSIKRPSDIPANPNGVYKNEGWNNWGDWLGTDAIATKYIEFVSFKEARKYARNLNLETVEEWYSLKSKRPNDIPSSPQRTYENKGWNGWGDFLAIENYRVNDIEWLPYEIARKTIRKLGLKNINDWYEYSRSTDLDKRIPRAPAVAYKNDGWKGIGDWIGTDKIADQFKKYLSFEDARKFMKAHKIYSLKEWRLYREENKIENIPYKLSRTYSDNWISQPHFFGTEIFSYKEAKEFINRFKLKSSREYFKFTKTTDSVVNLPGVPYRVYKDTGWVDWQDFLGYVKEKEAYSNRKYLSYSEAKKMIKENDISTIREWNAFRRQNENIELPSHPERIYKDNWKGWEDFLINKKSPYLSYAKAKESIGKMNFKSVKEFQAFSKTNKRPKNIPSGPYTVYKKTGEWKGWADFLGK